MKMKKILAAIAACAMSAAMLSMTAFAAGTESEEETLDETGTEETEEITEEETEEETPAEEEEETPAEEEEETPAQGNPGTGNSPIALAVIPVALAAAAVVAKKAK